MEEIWKDVVGYEGLYQVSNLGRVRSLDRVIETDCRWKNKITKKYKGKILKLNTNKKRHGYIYCFLGRGNSKKVHRLVAEAFLANPENKPQVNHRDMNVANNNIGNLEWVTNVENMRHAYQNGRVHKGKKGINRGTKNGMNKYTEEQVKKVKRSLSAGKKIFQILKENHYFSRGFVSKIKHEKNWKWLI